MLGHYIWNFVLTTLGMVVLLYGAYLYIRQHPQLGGGGNHRHSTQGNPLHVVSVLNLEPRKRLYVVGYKEQRFLVATTMEKTEFLATLESEPMLELPPEMTTDIAPMMASPVPLDASSGWMDRFRYSLKMVLADRFSGPGGK